MRFIHAHHITPLLDAETAFRENLARHSWMLVEGADKIQRHGLRLEDLPRRFKDNDREMAFIKDIISSGAQACYDDESGEPAYLLLSNADTCLAPNLLKRVIPVLETGIPCIHGPRRDFARLSQPLTIAEIETGFEYVGTDIFVIRPDWWESHKAQFPDMILGAEIWDHILRGMMRLEGLPSMSNLCYHAHHTQRWSRPENRNGLASNRHSVSLGHAWLNKLTPQQRQIVNYNDPELERKHISFTTSL